MSVCLFVCPQQYKGKGQQVTLHPPAATLLVIRESSIRSNKQFFGIYYFLAWLRVRVRERTKSKIKSKPKKYSYITIKKN